MLNFHNFFRKIQNSTSNQDGCRVKVTWLCFHSTQFLEKDVIGPHLLHVFTWLMMKFSYCRFVLRDMLATKDLLAASKFVMKSPKEQKRSDCIFFLILFLSLCRLIYRGFEITQFFVHLILRIIDNQLPWSWRILRYWQQSPDGLREEWKRPHTSEPSTQASTEMEEGIMYHRYGTTSSREWRQTGRGGGVGLVITVSHTRARTASQTRSPARLNWWSWQPSAKALVCMFSFRGRIWIQVF